MSAKRLSKLIPQSHITTGGFCLVDGSSLRYEAIETGRFEDTLWAFDGSQNRNIYSLKYCGERLPGGG